MNINISNLESRENIECIIYCPKSSLDRLLKEEIIIELPSQYSKYVLDRYNNSPIYRNFQLRDLNYKCKVRYIETDPNEPIPYNVNAILQYKYDNLINIQNEHINKDIKFIYILNDEIYGYREMIEILFYLGLGHQVIIVNEKLHPHNSFFAYKELMDSRPYIKKFIRIERDYFGKLDEFIKYCKDSDNLIKLFRTRRNLIENNYDISYIEFIEELKTKYMSYPTFRQKRVDFDAPYCSISDSNLSINRSCTFTMKPLLTFAYNFGHIIRLSNILEQQYRYTSRNIYMKKSNEYMNINNQIGVEKRTLLNTNIRDDRINIYDNNSMKEYREYILNKLNDYFEFLSSIDYIESYNELKQESDENSIEVAFGYNFFCMLRFDYDKLEDHERMKLDYIDYYIRQKYKFNGIDTLQELELVKTYPIDSENNKYVDYEFDSMREISKRIKDIFNQDNKMRIRLHKLYQDNLELESDIDVNIISKRYQINTRLKNLYHYILGDRFDINEDRRDRDIYDLLINREYVSDIEQSKKSKFPVFIDEKKPNISYIITDLTKQSDIISRYLEQRKKFNEELQKKLESDQDFRRNYTRAKRIRELKHYYPNLRKEEYDKLFEEEQEDLKKKVERGQKKLNRINKAIIEGKIPYIRLSNYFILDINNNRYNIYLSSVPDRSELGPILNEYSIEIKIETINNEEVLPIFEEKYNTVLIVENKKVYYRKKIYFVRDIPDIDDIVQIPIDSEYYINTELRKIPREIRTDKIGIYSNIFKSKIKEHFLEIKGYFLINGKKYYISTRKITKPNIEIYEFNQQQLNIILNLFKKTKYPIHKLFIPTQLYLVNTIPAKNLLLNIPIDNQNSNDYVLELFEDINKIKQLIPDTSVSTVPIKYITEEQTQEETIIEEEPIIIEGGKFDNRSSLQSGIIVVENTIEYPLTIIQGFYQFISLTYLMDLFNNINNGRNFLKLFRDTLYKEDKWKNLYLPESLNLK